MHHECARDATWGAGLAGSRKNRSLCWWLARGSRTLAPDSRAGAFRCCCVPRTSRWRARSLSLCLASELLGMKQAVRVMHTIHPVSITKCLGGQGRNGISALTVE